MRTPYACILKPIESTRRPLTYVKFNLQLVYLLLRLVETSVVWHARHRGGDVRCWGVHGSERRDESAGVAGGGAPSRVVHVGGGRVLLQPHGAGGARVSASGTQYDTPPPSCASCAWGQSGAQHTPGDTAACHRVGSRSRRAMM